MTGSRERGANVFKNYIGRRGCCTISGFLFLSFIFIVYLTYFRRPPTDELLRMNSKSFRSDSSSARRRPGVERGKSEGGAKEKGEEGQPVEGRDKWERFLKKNNYISVGEVYDKCGEERKKMLGQTIMLPDEINGGVKTRTFLNFTTDEDTTSGEFYIDVKYNNKDLYDNHWEICELMTEMIEDDKEEGLPEGNTPFKPCPIPKGQQYYVRDGKIPFYLPKGKFETTVWMKDDEDNIVMCGKSVFVL